MYPLFKNNRKKKKSDSKMNLPMSMRKREKNRRKNRNRTNSNIRKLCNGLESGNSSCSSLDNTIIVLDNPDCTLESNNSQQSVSKRKLLSQTNSDAQLSKKRKLDSTVVIITDDSNVGDQCSSSPIQVLPNNCSSSPIQVLPNNCSTPIAKKPSNVASNNNTESIRNFNDEINNLTKEINDESYVTVDLTTETNETKMDNNIIDLENTDADCTVVSVSNTQLSMSGDSDVTVLNMNSQKKKKELHMNEFVKGISKLNNVEKAKLLDAITKKIFNGCDVESTLKTRKKDTVSQSTETPEATYIKEVILGQASSRNSIGSNIYNPERDGKNKTGLRMVVIDGSNVAMEHGRGKVFSVKGLKICIDYFLKRGHSTKAFVPRFRCKFGKSSDPRLLDDLERNGLVVYTPSREIQGRMVTSYDDRYIVQCAAEFDGVIVSGDNYRDLLSENPRWRFVIENRLLPFTWVNDMIMFPKDPLGRHGPSLEQFLRHDNSNNTIKLK